MSTLIAALFLALAASPAAADPTTFNCTDNAVNDVGLQTDLTAATSGETIVIDGLCAGSFTLPSNTPLTLEGATGTTSGFDGQGVQQTDSLLSGTSLDDVTLQDLTFENAVTSAVADDPSTLELAVENGALTLSGDTFTNNVDNADDEPPVYIESDYGDSGCTTQDNSVVVENSTFSDNRLDQSGSLPGPDGPAFPGGGAGLELLAWCEFDPVTLTGNTFKDNIVDSTDAEAPAVGGGLSIIGITPDASDALIPVTQSGNVFDGNSIEAAPGDQYDFWGGGGEWAQGADLQSENDSFTNNVLPGSDSDYGSNGAGLAVQGGCSSALATLNQDVVDDNTIAMETADSPESSYGAGIEFYGESSYDYLLYLLETDAPDADAAFYDLLYADFMCGYESGSPALPASGVLGTFNPPDAVNAPAQLGGAPAGGIDAAQQLFAAPADAGDLTLDDSTVTDNAVTDGGTPAASDSGATAGIAGDYDDTLELDNTIAYGDVGGTETSGFTGDESLATKDPPIAADPITANNSDFCDPNNPSSPLAPGNNICADPLLVDDSYSSSTTTPDVHETSSSPTIDAGSNDLVASGLTADFYGVGREVAGHTCPVGAGTVDIGAAEFIPTCTTPTPAAISTPTPSSPPPLPAKVLQPCASRRNIVMHLQYEFLIPAGIKLSKVNATLTSSTVPGFGVKRVTAYGPKLELLRLDFRSFPFGTFRVHIRVTFSNGKTEYQQRVWHTCRPFHWKYPTPQDPHPHNAKRARG